VPEGAAKGGMDEGLARCIARCGDASKTCFVPRWRSGILEREPGGLRSGMFFHMVKMISCVCE